MGFVANAAFGRFSRGAEIPRDEFSAAELAVLEADGFITEDKPAVAAAPPADSRKAKARKVDDAVLRPPAEQP